MFVWLLYPERSWRELAWGMIPLGVAGAAMAWYNFTSFGNPFELGYQYMRLEGLLAHRLAEHGAFSLAFLGGNLHNALIKLPNFQIRGLLL